MVDVSEAKAGDARLEKFFQAHRTTRVARRGAVLDVREKPALIASRDDEVVGVLSYDIDGADCEVVHMRASGQWGGVGTALLDRLDAVARTRVVRGCRSASPPTTTSTRSVLPAAPVPAARRAARRRRGRAQGAAVGDPRGRQLQEFHPDELEFERTVDADG